MSIEAKRFYSNKLLNRINSICDTNQLPVVGGEFDGQIPKGRHFKDYLPDYNVVAPNDIVEAALFNARFPDALRRLLLIGGAIARESYIDSLGGSDFTLFPQIAATIARSSSPKQQEHGVVIRTIFGATEQMPFRALSYLLPALVYAKNLTDVDTTVPQLQFIFAMNASGILNGLDMQRARDQVLTFAQIGRRFVRKYFPDLEQRTIFAEDHPDNLDGLAGIAQQIDYKLTDAIKNQLLAKGGSNGGMKQSLSYAAAHLQMHDRPDANLVGLFIDQPEIQTPREIISIGGYPERLFYQIRHLMKPHLGVEFRQMPTAQLFTKHRVPPYYMARDGDLSMEEVLTDASKIMNKEKVGATASYDLNHLQNITSRGEDLVEFLRS